jgi:hypothetical protein
MQQATDIQSAVRGDTSKAPRSTANDQADAVDRAIESIQQHTAATEANAKAVGLGDAAMARFRVEAKETAAVQANGRKETAEQAAQFKELQDRAEAAADALAKARVNSSISRGSQTALLSSEDQAIAEKLKPIFGDDIPAALDSSYAAAIRFNEAMRSVSSSIEGDLTTGLTNLKSDTVSLKDGFSSMAQSILRDIEQMIIKMTIVQPLMRSLQGAFSGGITGIVNPLAGAFSFDSGGYTGPGGVHQPAGVVHKGEVVWSQADVSRAGGVGVVESMRRGLSGYDSGGPVADVRPPDVYVNSQGGFGEVLH